MNSMQTTDGDEITRTEGNQHFAQGPVESLRILVVDDDDLNQKMMSILLSQLGHSVETTSSSEDVINLLESRKFDLVFLDIHMPFMDGYEISQWIRLREDGKRHIPIVALTASNPSGQAERCLAAGMDDYLCKPFDQAQLAKILASCVNGRYQPAPSGRHPSDLTGVAKPVLDIPGALPYVGNDVATYKELLAEFVSSLPGTMAKLQGDLNSANWQELLSHMHQLRGRSAVLGATLLASLCVKMEQQVQDGQTNLTDETLKEIDRCIQHLRSDADDFLNDTKG